VKTEELFDMVTSIPAAAAVIKDSAFVKAVSNTSTVTLRVVEGDEKEVSDLRQ
jgi:hypothetical protein